MIVKKIDAYRNDNSRVIVYFEDRSYITVDALEADRLGLKAGMELDDHILPALGEDSRSSAARATAARIVGRHSMSCKTLMEKLRDRGIAEADAAAALEWLCDLGIMDDLKYGDMLVRHYRAKGFGNRRIREELRQRGISREDMDTLLEEAVDMQDEILGYIKKRIRGKELDRSLASKIEGALVRRGHSFEEIRSAFHALEIEMEENY